MKIQSMKGRSWFGSPVPKQTQPKLGELGTAYAISPIHFKFRCVMLVPRSFCTDQMPFGMSSSIVSMKSEFSITTGTQASSIPIAGSICASWLTLGFFVWFALKWNQLDAWAQSLSVAPWQEGLRVTTPSADFMKARRGTMNSFVILQTTAARRSSSQNRCYQKITKSQAYFDRKNSFLIVSIFSFANTFNVDMFVLKYCFRTLDPIHKLYLITWIADKSSADNF